ncbi:MAG: RNA polymerase sigma factor [Chloroflexota bacterium]
MLHWKDASDAELLYRAQDGNAEAFGELYERHAQAVFRFLYSHLSNRLDAEDITGDVFLRAWRSLPKFREQGVPFVAFLLRVARNALIDFYRRTRNVQEDDIDEIVLPDHSAGPGEAFSARLESQKLRQTMQQLSEDYRTVLTLRFISELSVEETCAVMGKSDGAVRVLQHRALAALRKLLENSKDSEQ